MIGFRLPILKSSPNVTNVIPLVKNNPNFAVLIYDVEFIRRNIKFVYILVLPVYFFIIQNSILNKHTHVFSNGIVITHSHFVDEENNEPLNEHKHTKSEIQLFCDLSIDFYFVPEQTQLDHFIFENFLEYIVENENAAILSPILTIDSRGPPAFQIS